jgi:hypothetical protein
MYAVRLFEEGKDVFDRSLHPYTRALPGCGTVYVTEVCSSGGYRKAA